MFSEKNIVVTIGNYGAVVALHEKNEIKNKIFLEELSDDIKIQLKEVFVKNKSAPLYVLLDTVDQSYKKKIYPSVRKGDLLRIIKRDLAADGDKESIKNYMILNAKKTKTKETNKRWEALFISSSNSEILNKWLDFLLDMPNHLVGIYMLPIETFSLFELLKTSLKAHSKIQNKHNDLYCLVIQNKVSGIRQMVFSNQGIVFTRVVNYNFEQPDFLEKYEQDIYSTFEYLKRLFPDFAIAELDIVNIFPAAVLEILKKINNVELNFINFTPNQVASEIGQANLLQANSNFCDLLISKIFSKEKKILRFTTKKINFLERFFVILKSSYYANLVLLMMICAMILFTVISQEKISELIEIADTQKFSAFQELEKLKKSALEGTKITEDDKVVDIERISDFGKVQEILGSIGTSYYDIYVKLKFLKDFNVRLTKFSYLVPNINGKSPTVASNNYEFSFGGQLDNKSGDIEDLFKEFDALVIEVKKNLGASVKYNDLPRNIDFNKKYYSFPVEFTVSTKPAAGQNKQVATTPATNPPK